MTLDLESIHTMLLFSFYDKCKFTAITILQHNLVCMTLLFSSCKSVVTGAGSSQYAHCLPFS